MPQVSDNNRMAPGEDGVNGNGSASPGDDGNMSDKQWLQLFKSALDASDTFKTETLATAWARNYRAFQNKHVNGSKYETTKYRNRSKLFRPKTRMAVRKNDASAAGALFSTDEVVKVSAERSTDKVQAMVAKMVHAILNYRFDRSNKMAGPSWFLTVIGARQDTQITGICVSKQYWEYEERVVPTYVDQPAFTADMIPLMDENGQPVTEEHVVDKVEIVRDRPNIILIQPEHAYIDPTGDWRDPIQEGGHFIAGYPTRKEDLEDMLNQNSETNRMGGARWRTDIDTSNLTSGNGRTRQTQQVGRSRDDGVDRYDSRHSDKNGSVLWLYECFYRIDGTDWTWWTLGENIILSDPCPVEEAYPEQRGDRPYVRGVGALETHRTHPTAPVETWQPMQQEMNEITNLGLDTLKMGISPITKVKRGREVDMKQVQNRGPDAHISVMEMDDVQFDRAPGPPPQVREYMNGLNTDFDELAGVFSNGSIQTNRQMNETVGGMQLLSSSANALTEFDLRVFVETYVEPVLHQIVRCIQHYETDEEILTICGERCGLIENVSTSEPSPQGQQGLDGAKPPVRPEDKVTVEQAIAAMDKLKLSVKVNVGIGAMDSQQKLQKLMAGMDVTMKMAPVLAKSGVELDAVSIVQEAWGLIGYKDADRFFKSKVEEPASPPPEVQMEMLRHKNEMERLKFEQDHKEKLATADNQIDNRKLDLQQMMDEFTMMVDTATTKLSVIQQMAAGMAAPLPSPNGQDTLPSSPPVPQVASPEQGVPLPFGQ